MYIFSMTLSTAPCIVGMMEAVQLDSRGIAMGLSSFGSHIFGDVLSPLVVGFLTDKYNSLVPGMWVLAGWGVLTILFWGMASLPERKLAIHQDNAFPVAAEAASTRQASLAVTA